jgi:hypothetical protein
MMSIAGIIVFPAVLGLIGFGFCKKTGKRLPMLTAVMALMLALTVSGGLIGCSDADGDNGVDSGSTANDGESGDLSNDDNGNSDDSPEENGPPPGNVGGNANKAKPDINPTFSGDATAFFGLQWFEAWQLSGDGARPKGYDGEVRLFGDGSERDPWELIDESDMWSVPDVKSIGIENDKNGMEINSANTINDVYLYTVNSVSVKNGSDVSFFGIKIGDGLTAAEERLTGMADRIKGGIMGRIYYESETDGEISQIAIGAGLHKFPVEGDVLSFFEKKDVNRYLTNADEITVSWTAEIDGTIYDVSLTTSDRKTVNAITATSYDNEDIRLGYMGDPFSEPNLGSGDFTLPSRLVGLEGLDLDYWRD